MSKQEAAVAEETGAAAPAETPAPAACDRAVKGGEGQRAKFKAQVPGPVRVRVTFEEPAEFVEELASRAERIEGGVVRYLLRYEPPGEGYGVRKVELVAGAVVDGEIVELVARAGSVWGDGGAADQETKRRVDGWHAQLVDLCGSKGLALKGGRFGAV